jgi:hypothetical protein
MQVDSVCRSGLKTGKKGKGPTLITQETGKQDDHSAQVDAPSFHSSQHQRFLIDLMNISIILDALRCYSIVTRISIFNESFHSFI